MARFINKFLNANDREDVVNTMALKIFDKFDTDRSGFLEKMETYRLLNEIMASQGKPNATIAQFTRFFNEFDFNGDGVISKSEITRFIKKFLNIPSSDEDDIVDLVQKTWYKYDTDRSGYLEKRETLKFLDNLLA
jgi:Ca2+-binding EF-hand superfamily protein